MGHHISELFRNLIVWMPGYCLQGKRQVNALSTFQHCEDLHLGDLLMFARQRITQRHTAPLHVSCDAEGYQYWERHIVWIADNAIQDCIAQSDCSTSTMYVILLHTPCNKADLMLLAYIQ